MLKSSGELEVEHSADNSWAFLDAACLRMCFSLSTCQGDMCVRAWVRKTCVYVCGRGACVCAVCGGGKHVCVCAVCGGGKHVCVCAVCGGDKHVIKKEAQQIQV